MQNNLENTSDIEDKEIDIEFKQYDEQINEI